VLVLTAKIEKNPGLAAFYDVRPGNAARLFLQLQRMRGNLNRVVILSEMAGVYNVVCKQINILLTYLNMRLISPFKHAMSSGKPMQAGTRYSSAGYNSDTVNSVKSEN